jgi:membrane protein
VAPRPRLRRGALANAVRGAQTRFVAGGWTFVGRGYRKAAQDDIFFLAGGIAFNVLLGAIPFLLLLVSIFGYVLRTTVSDPEARAIDYVFSILPPSQEVSEFVRAQIEELLTSASQFGIIGIILLVWVSTRLIGSIRTALRDIFDIPEDRGIIAGKIFDAQMVVVAGTLFVANTAISVLLEAVQTYGIELLGLRHGGTIQTLQVFYAQLIAYAFIFLMFVLIYRYLPARRIPWRIAVVSATFSSAVFELLKSAFAWYIANLANYKSTYGYLATAAVLVFWVYYSAVVFVLGGEVGQVYDLYRTRRRQRELLD